MTRRQVTVGAPYVALVGTLAGVTHSQPNQTFGWAWALCLILCLPVLVIGLPFVYVLGAAVWNVTDAGDGGPMWPVTVVYTVLFCAIAIGNCLLLGPLAARLRRRAVND